MVTAQLVSISLWARAVCDDTLHQPRETVSWVALAPAAAAALVFITVSVRDKDKLRSLRAVKGSFHRDVLLSPVYSAHLLSIIRPQYLPTFVPRV